MIKPKHLEVNARENLNVLSFKKMPKAKFMKEKKLQIQNSSYFKISYSKDEKISHGLRENTCKPFTEKRFIYTLYKDFLKLNKNTTNY